MTRPHFLSLGGSRWRRLALVAALAAGSAAAQAADPLPSWNSGPTKQAIVAFVKRVTTPGGKDFVPLPERIAAFDNDGALASEQLPYFQLAFALLLKSDPTVALAGCEKAMVEMIVAANPGMTSSAGLASQPMLELLGYLRANGFQTYVCSGRADVNAIIHIQLALLPRQSVRDSSITTLADDPIRAATVKER